jgi:protein-S-isoprenylcysteine O-methyltransferase Ste14
MLFRLAHKVEQAHVLMTLAGLLNMGVVVAPLGRVAVAGRGIERVGYVLFAVGVVLFVTAGITLWWGLRNGASGQSHLVTNGVYRWLRHPMYVGFVLAMLGADVIIGSLAGLIITVVLFLPATRRRARHEEAILACELGEEWSAYASRTPSLLLLDWPTC